MTEYNNHPRHQLDPIFLTPVRFSAMAALNEGTEIDFVTLRNLIETNDSALSKAVNQLVAAAYVATRRVFDGKHPRTWIRTTSKGRRAYEKHVKALQEIVQNGSTVSSD